MSEGPLPASPSTNLQDSPARSLPCDYSAELKGFEVNMLSSALRQAKFHQGKAARLLGMNYTRFRSLYRKHETHVAKLQG